MAAATFDSILRDLKNKVYHPIYFFHGEEPYFIDLLAGYIETHPEPSLNAPNQTTLLSPAERPEEFLSAYRPRLNVAPLLLRTKCPLWRQKSDRR